MRKKKPKPPREPRREGDRGMRPKGHPIGHGDGNYRAYDPGKPRLDT